MGELGFGTSPPPSSLGGKRDMQPAPPDVGDIAQGAVDRLCDYDAWNAPGDFDSTAERIADFLGDFVRIAAVRLAGTVENGPRLDVPHETEIDDGDEDQYDEVERRRRG